MTLQPIQHNDALCGPITVDVTSDHVGFDNYATFNEAQMLIDFDFDQYDGFVQDDLTTITITASNSHGATITELVQLSTHICNITSNYAGDYICSFALNSLVGVCEFATDDDNVHFSCFPTYFEVDVDQNGVYDAND